jgi:hypothetical protein
MRAGGGKRRRTPSSAAPMKGVKAAGYLKRDFVDQGFYEATNRQEASLSERQAGVRCYQEGELIIWNCCGHY